MPYKEKKIEKKYFSIGEVAFMFKVAPSLIRFWEKEFDILSPQKNRKGNRQYTNADILNFKLIFHLVKEKGYTLQGAKEFLKDHKNQTGTEGKNEVKESLLKLKDFLIELREKL
ncbi:MAG TPA: MerR family transcriptional regulator [Cytophagaceae bacterium]|jgi:DNA-binding transcriptional MerR regulator|nr:MerR family transcriptional regulator [Cytophagaceae bacterium]